MVHEIILAGFGGQGILMAGKLLAYAGMLDGKHVSWLPSYGPEMRGGTANSSVVISDRPVDSPVLYSCNELIVMNRPSLDKFENLVEEGGVIVMDSSIVDRDVKRGDIESFKVPATKMASEMGNMAFANIILLGKLIKERKTVTVDNLEKALYEVLPEKKRNLIPMEIKALKTGMEYI
ncbi:2-oxoglutarate synthase subunit KorC [Thermoclostridium stercorarium subsp. stercorarium DSM 8532]|jgi:2-oxoglutarate ferredoxin oxidoreductase subunit gamma|uniref:2-oxoglutarate synthase subunit KorC n=3 Tax=Thermoclostridium stercorarium TaxID=1510 RepID=L7VNA9_THES1|nr:2-oxoacid:acceptor oxidoreductase family protein [Thermoclostridium stercorarium]AGC68242.1 2-oxoglutarate synthase subunit KorC [Thermoclostridium stercorarium subsp. stercorarium DSM 8532]AGI39269.1 pyruvate-ferredoxin oxidoreductase gamma subunit [Thermoclostridium stercorarium subsp. stercorarium DSM 8532]ANW98604.1 2-oxoacid:ferredoxin oxidoreductase subunit gamma [Thermoclostridium stercorarium subsp. thermolacticum DSM 2910]ANX01146.1 2-oxoacid:ferredoxin oxidoreductase subunit gamma 